MNVWVRSIAAGGPRCAVAVLSQPARPSVRPTRSTVGRVVAIGSVRADLTICSLTSDLAGDVGLDAERLIGVSLLQLVEPADAGRLLELVADPSGDGACSAQTVRLRMHKAEDLRYEVLLVPYVNDDGYAFTVIDVRDTQSSSDQVLHARLERGTSRATVSSVSADPATLRSQALFRKLGGRELEVVTELLNGNRVPAIATKLYLSPGTVRNHLSTAFRKLGVHSQQELIDLLRCLAPIDP